MIIYIYIYTIIFIIIIIIIIIKAEEQLNCSTVSRQNSQTIYRSSAAALLLQPLNSENNSPTSPHSPDNHLDIS